MESGTTFTVTSIGCSRQTEAEEGDQGLQRLRITHHTRTNYLHLHPWIKLVLTDQRVSERIYRSKHQMGHLHTTILRESNEVFRKNNVAISEVKSRETGEVNKW